MPTFQGRPSTDGTEMGADIADLFGTDDEEEIIRIGVESHRQMLQDNLTGMSEEQDDWDADE